MHSLPATDTATAASFTPAIHPPWLRAAHWLNALAVLLMVASGWRIYDAAPLFDLRFPRELTLGGWLGGALQWHFAAMWLLGANGLFYLTLNLATGRFRRTFLTLRLSDIWHDFAAALRSRLSHGDSRKYNAVQRAAYLFAVADLVLLVLSGLVLWKSVQFPYLRLVLGGYEGARRVHFFAMAALVGFVAIHLTMVVLVPRSLLAMLGLHRGASA